MDISNNTEEITKFLFEYILLLYKILIKLVNFDIFIHNILFNIIYIVVFN